MSRPDNIEGLPSSAIARLLIDIGIPPEEAARHAHTEGDVKDIFHTAGVRLRQVSVNDLGHGKASAPLLAQRTDGANTRTVIVREIVKAGLVIDDGDERQGMLLNWSEAGNILSDITLPTMIERAGPNEAFGISWFERVTRRHGASLLLVLAASAMINLLSLAVPLVFKVIIDRVVVSGAEASAYVLAITLIVVAALQGCIGLVRSMINTEVNLQAGAETTGLIFGHVLRMPLEKLQASPIGELAARIASADAALDYMTKTRITTAFNIVFALVFITVLLFISPLLTLIVAAAMPPYIALHVATGRMSRKRIERQFATQSALRSRSIEYLGGIETLKAVDGLRAAETDVGDRFAANAVETEKVGRLQQLLSAGASFLTRSMEAGVILVGTLAVIGGTMTLGGLIAFYIIMGRVRDPLLQLSGFVETRQKAIEATERLRQIMEVPDESMGRGQRALPLALTPITLRGVGFGYSSETPPILRGIDLDIATGEKLALVGPSGSGKSTLLKTIAGMHMPSPGTLCFQGHEAMDFSPSEIRSRIGYVNQGARLFSGTIRSNLAMGTDWTDDALWMALDQVDGAALVAGLPAGLDSEIRENGSNLSGGQCQRLTLARILLREPEVLLLDEATSALDEASEAAIFERLAKRANCTVVFATHRTPTLRFADRVVEMKGGLLVGPSVGQVPPKARRRLIEQPLAAIPGDSA